MKKRLTSFFKYNILIIVGILISTSTIVAYATVYIDSKEVSYTNNDKSTVFEAIDNLYNEYDKLNLPLNKRKYLSTEDITKDNVDSYISNLKINNDDWTDKDTVAWTNWKSLSTASGYWNWDKDVEHSSISDFVMSFEISNVEDFYKSSIIHLKLFCYDGTEDSLNKSGNTEYYTKMAWHGTEQTWDVLPEITIYKDINSYSFNSITSNTDVSIYKYSLTISDTKITDKSIYKDSYWWGSFSESSNKLTLYYSARTETYNDSCRGKRFNVSTEAKQDAYDNWWYSSASDGYWEIGGYDPRYTYVCNKWYDYKINYSNLNGRLISKYNNWQVTIAYYD